MRDDFDYRAKWGFHAEEDAIAGDIGRDGANPREYIIKQRVAGDVEVFLSRGGVIQECEFGTESGDLRKRRENGRIDLVINQGRDTRRR